MSNQATTLTDAAQRRIRQLVAEAPAASAALVAKLSTIFASAPDMAAAGPPSPAANAIDPPPAEERSREQPTAAA